MPSLVKLLMIVLAGLFGGLLGYSVSEVTEKDLVETKKSTSEGTAATYNVDGPITCIVLRHGLSCNWEKYNKDKLIKKKRHQDCLAWSLEQRTQGEIKFPAVKGECDE